MTKKDEDNPEYTGNSGTQGVGMIDNKITAAEAMQMSLLEAQKENIEADTNLKEADANKTRGVDTDEKKAIMDNIIANTKNENTKNKLMEVQTNLLKIEETESNMSREDRMYNIKMNMRKTTYRDWETDRKSTRLNSSHRSLSRMPSSA